MKVKIYDRLIHPLKGLIFLLNLNDNNFPIIDNKYQLIGTKIEVDGKNYVIKEMQKTMTAAPIEWKQDRPIAIVVKEIST